MIPHLTDGEGLIQATWLVGAGGRGTHFSLCRPSHCGGATQVTRHTHTQRTRAWAYTQAGAQTQYTEHTRRAHTNTESPRDQGTRADSDSRERADTQDDQRRVILLS